MGFVYLNLSLVICIEVLDSKWCEDCILMFKFLSFVVGYLVVGFWWCWVCVCYDLIDGDKLIIVIIYGCLYFKFGIFFVLMCYWLWCIIY